MTVTLKLWYPEHLAPSSAQPGGSALRQQIHDFEEYYPRFKISGVRMGAYGPGGLLDYLRTTSRILPEELPDLVALDLNEVPQAAELGVLQAMDYLLPAELLEALFPFANAGSLYRGQRVAVPYEVDARFLAYNQAMVNAVPSTWEELLASDAHYLLPLGSGDILNSDALLLQYHALGGELIGQGGQLVLDESKLADVLAFFQQGLDQKVIHAATLTTTTLSEVWQIYIAGEVALAEASAHQYLVDRHQLKNTRLAMIPSKEGNAATVIQGWAWCLVTPDLQRQEGAIAFLLWLMDRENLAARCASSLYLPARRDAMLGSVGDADMAAFFTTLLDHAYPRPATSEYEAIAQAMYEALRKVLAGNSAPEQAARQVGAVIERIRQERTAGKG